MWGAVCDDDVTQMEQTKREAGAADLAGGRQRVTTERRVCQGTPRLPRKGDCSFSIVYLVHNVCVWRRASIYIHVHVCA